VSPSLISTFLAPNTPVIAQSFIPFDAFNLMLFESTAIRSSDLSTLRYLACHTLLVSTHRHIQHHQQTTTFSLESWVDMDPLSLTVGAISIVGISIGTCAKLLHDARSKYKGAGLTIASMTTACVTIQTALCEIEKPHIARPSSLRFPT
jgi:hypothetical protein